MCVCVCRHLSCHLTFGFASVARKNDVKMYVFGVHNQYFTQRFVNIITFTKLRTNYCTLILLYLSYGKLIWENTCKSYLDELVKLQNWSIRTVSDSHYKSHTGPLFSKNNLLMVTDMYTLELGVFMFKYSINGLPGAFKDYFKKRSDTHDYQTRHGNDFNLTKIKRPFPTTLFELVDPLFGIHFLSHWEILNL